MCNHGFLLRHLPSIETNNHILFFRINFDFRFLKAFLIVSLDELHFVTAVSSESARPSALARQREILEVDMVNCAQHHVSSNLAFLMLVGATSYTLPEAARSGYRRLDYTNAMQLTSTYFLAYGRCSSRGKTKLQISKVSIHLIHSTSMHSRSQANRKHPKFCVLLYPPSLWHLQPSRRSVRLSIPPLSTHPRNPGGSHSCRMSQWSFSCHIWAIATAPSPAPLCATIHLKTIRWW